MEESKTVGSATKLMVSSSILALALGAGLSTPAAAGVIVTDLHNHVVNPGDSFDFGPNGDDFTITNTTSTGSPFGFIDLMLQGNDNGFGENLVAVDSPTSHLHHFGPGDTVDGSATFESSGTDSLFKLAKPHVFYGLQITPTLETTSVLDADPWGYLEIQVDFDGDLLLKSFAFEENEGEPVRIPSSVPEPEMLGLFAMGAVGLLAARRRKRQQAQ